MAAKFYFDCRDVFRTGRLGFRGKKMMMHFLGLMLGYVIYEALTYLSLISSDRVGEFWGKYGLRPVFFIADKLTAQLPTATIIMMAVGVFIWVIIYYFFSTAVAKIAVEELRGDDFYSMKEAFRFAGKHWKSVYVTIVALIGIFAFCLFWPSLVGLLDLIPGVEQAAEHFGTPATTFLAIPVYFIGLFMMLLTFVFAFGLFLIPPIVAVTGADPFETIYQLFSTVWNQPWRLIIYEILLMIVKIVSFAVFAAFSVVGMCIAFLPSTLLAKQEGSYYFAEVIARSLNWIGGIGAESLVSKIPVEVTSGAMPWTLDVATFFLCSSLIMVVAIVLSYFLSMMSSGHTILYVILRKKITDENMLEVEDDDDIRMDVMEEPEKSEESKESEAQESEDSEEKSEDE